VQHANGTMAWLAIEAVATLIGTFDYRGGMTAGAGGWDDAAGVVNLKTVPGGVSAAGPRIDRAATAYPDVAGLSTRDGYPAKRPWFPFAVLGNYQEIIPGIADQYPYPAKVLITYWNAFPCLSPNVRLSGDMEPLQAADLYGTTPILPYLRKWRSKANAPSSPRCSMNAKEMASHRL
jgi:anaerobic selenocysteine-containing dehydrogenase